MIKKTMLALTALAIASRDLPVADTPEELIAQGDALYAQRQDPLLAAQALARYQEALQAWPRTTSTALSRTRRSCTMSATTPPRSSEKLKIFKQAMDICKKAIALAPGTASRATTGWACIPAAMAKPAACSSRFS